jgi:hypothetical protein
MKRLLFILSFYSSVLNAQVVTITLGKDYSSNGAKTILAIPPANTKYRAFGWIENTSPVLSNPATRLTYFCRVGDSHLENGYAEYIHYDVATKTWGDWQIYDDPPMPDHRDTWGGRMYYGGDGSGDSIIVFGQQTWNNLDGHDWSSLDIYFYKIGIADFGFSGKTSIFTAFPTLPRLFRGEVFGHLSKGDSPGEYYIMLFQWNDDPSLPPPSRYLVNVLHTTNYFRSGNEVLTIIDGTDQFSEGTVEYLGNGKLVSFIRDDRGGKLNASYSTDYGATWTYPQATNLGYYGLGVKIPFSYPYKGKYNIIFQDRDAGPVCISRNNDTATFFNHLLNYNQAEIWAQNSSTTTVGNATLGYPSQVVIDSVSNVFMNCWTYEDTNTRATIRYTISKLDTSAGLPLAPPVIKTDYITDTRFRFDLMSISGVSVPGGYTEAQLANIKYFKVDIATDPGFTTFPVVRWGHVIDPPSVVHDMIVPATWMLINNLTPNTTYYVRVKAVNFNGESSYTTTTVTTSP